MKTINAESPNSSDPRGARLARCALAAIVMFPIALAFYTMCTHWVSLPYWDAWHTPGEQIASWCNGTLSFAELFSQHNEHRPFFPRLVYVPMAAAFGWDVRREMALGFVLLCAGSAALFGLLRQTVGHAKALHGLALMNVLVFTPRQYQNLLSGAEGGSFLPTVALLVALTMNLSRSSLGLKTVANVSLAFASTYTFGNGMLLWPLAFPIENRMPDAAQQASRTSQLLWRALYMAIGAASISAYFIGYQHPVFAPAPAQTAAELPAMFHFLVRWLGAFFLVDSATAIGGATLLIFVALGITAIRLMRKTGEWRPHYPWLLLGVYVLLSGCITARARLGFGLQMASDWRYTAFTVFLHVAIIGLGLSVYRQLPMARPPRRTLATCGLIYVVAIASLSVSALARERTVLTEFRDLRERLRPVIKRSITAPNDPDMKLLSPYSETPKTIRSLAGCGVLGPVLQ